MRPVWILIIILVTAAYLRIYNLDKNPPAAYGDEISFAWNAWNILKTGTDEYGMSFPLQFRAFDDYKAPIPVYLLVPFLTVFGLNTFAVRLPIAIFAVATIWITYLLGAQLINKKIGLVSALLLTISSWHLHLSRGFFESTLSLFFFVTALYFFIIAKSDLKKITISAVFFTLTLYSYFTPRIFLVLFIPFLFWWSRRQLGKEKIQVIGFWAVLIVLLLPLIYLSLFNKGLSRIQKLTAQRESAIVKQVEFDRVSADAPLYIQKLLHNKPLYWVKFVLNDYLEQLSLNFWYVSGDSSLRYFLGQMGMFYLIELPFLIIGLPVLWSKSRSSFWLILGWLLLSPVPASLSGRPFGVRSLAMLPAPFFIVASGLDSVWRYLKNHSLWMVKLVIVTGFGLSIGYYLVRYHVEYPHYAATWWGWENKVALDLALRDQDKYDQIFLSNFYSGLDLAFAYYIEQDPLQYRQVKGDPVMLVDGRMFWKFGKFYIGSLDLDKERLSQGLIPPKSLYIGRPEEADSAETITAPDDGRILFKIYRTE